MGGLLSQTSPVSLSRTASLLNAGRMSNRCADGSALSQFGVTPIRSCGDRTGAATAANITTQSPRANMKPLDHSLVLLIQPSCGDEVVKRDTFHTPIRWKLSRGRFSIALGNG